MVESAKDTLKAPAHCNFRLSNNAPIAELYLIKIAVVLLICMKLRLCYIADGC